MKNARAKIVTERLQRTTEMLLPFTVVRAELSVGNGGNGSSKQVVLDQWTRVGVCGGCVDGCGCWVADNGRGRDDGWRDCDAVVVSGHVL